jgi:hypothetical protein
MNHPAPPLTLISHALCPYVQRVATVLAEKGLSFERREVDLANKPDWFRAVSPLGKTPVLLVGETPIFESAVICEYLEDVAAPRLHPADALERARHRAWIEFGAQMLNTIAGLYSAPDEPARRALVPMLLSPMCDSEHTSTTPRFRRPHADHDVVLNTESQCRVVASMRLASGFTTTTYHRSALARQPDQPGR